MRLSNLTDLKLQQLADDHRTIGSRRIPPEVFEELIDRRAEMSPDRFREASFAYMYAADLIENECSETLPPVGAPFLFEGTWFDLDSADVRQELVDDAVDYLNTRKLLIERSVNGRRIAIICDEGEPHTDAA